MPWGARARGPGPGPYICQVLQAGPRGSRRHCGEGGRSVGLRGHGGGSERRVTFLRSVQPAGAG
eukprot:3734797-Lingulodinium_polyedra.AAC.1